jgi:hypothetical protein
MMDFTSEAIDVMTSDRAGYAKCRIGVGYVIGKHLYSMQTFAAIYPSVDGEPQPPDRIIAASQRTYDHIPPTGTVILPVFAHDLGVPCGGYDDADDTHHVECEPVGEMVLNYVDKFLFINDKLPMEYAYLKPMRSPLE